MWFNFWWQVRIPFLTVTLPVLLAQTAYADIYLDAVVIFALLLVGFALDGLKQFLESRNIKVNNAADQQGVRKAATVCTSRFFSRTLLDTFR